MQAFGSRLFLVSRFIFFLGSAPFVKQTNDPRACTAAW